MGGKAYKDRVLRARKFVVQSLELPRGIGQYAEPLLQRIARELVALTHDKQEDDATTPATWNQDDVQRRWAELRGVDYKPHQSSSSAGPPGPAPASSLAPPTVLAGGRIEVVNGTVMFRTQPKHVSSRACDLFAVDASERIRAGALSFRTTHAHADKTNVHSEEDCAMATVEGLARSYAGGMDRTIESTIATAPARSGGLLSTRHRGRLYDSPGAS